MHAPARMSGLRGVAVVTALLTAALVATATPAAAAPAAGAPPAAAEPGRVQLVTCPSGEDGRPLRLAESFAAPGAEDLAAQLDYYRAGLVGVFAPRGWSCHAWLGSGGEMLLVTPRALPPPYFPLPSITGPAVLIQRTDTSASGRFHVAIAAAQLFPLLGHPLVEKVRGEHLIADSSFDAKPYPDDHLQYLSDRLVAYTTPAHTSGLGTDSLFDAGDLPIRGVTALTPGGAVQTLHELRVRLPAAQRALGNAVLDLQIRCFQLVQGCRALTD